MGKNLLKPLNLLAQKLPNQSQSKESLLLPKKLNQKSKAGHPHGHDCDDDFGDPFSKGAGNTALIELTRTREVFVAEGITTKTATTLCNTLLYFQHVDPEAPVTIYINTNGGEVAALTQMYDVMRLVSNPIATVCLGKAYSAGAWLLATGTPGMRSAYKHSRIMIHGMQLGFPVAPDVSEHESNNYIEWCDKVNERILRILAKHTGQSFEKIKNDCAKDLFLTAEEALKYGLIDKLI